MRHARTVLRRGGFGLWMVCVLNGAGCTHNYYYTYDPCSPGGGPVVTSPVAVQSGALCDVPTRVVGGSSSPVASVPSAVATPMASRPRPPRVVMSEPSANSRLSWRRADPDAGLATTRVEGGVVEEPTAIR